MYEIPEWGPLQTIGFDEHPRLEIWDSHEEMLAELETRGISWIEVRPHLPRAAIYVAITIAGVTIAFGSQMSSTKQLARFEGLPLWYLGWDTYVAGIDVSTLTQAFEFDVILFHGFARHSAREILVIYELGVVLIEPDGKEIWHYYARDIVLRWELLPDALRLVIWEGDHDEIEVLLDWATGKEIEELTPRRV